MKAEHLQNLEGLKQADAEKVVKSWPGEVRTYLTTQMVTQDFNPARLNLVISAKTGLVNKAYVG